MAQTSVIDYFKQLSELMLRIEATDKTGAKLSLEDGIERATQLILNVRAASGKIMLAGNGGSAAIVSHMQNDLCTTADLKAMVFTEQPLLTALANDNGYPSVYERPIELWAEAGDLVWTVSSSGQSENIIRAHNAGLQAKCGLITFSGFKPDNPSRKMGDVNFFVDSNVYCYVESAHTALAHFLTTLALSGSED
jgi:D-sedoheptulose 7-phosphate isomerase